MVVAEKNRIVDQFNDDGYYVYRGLLDPKTDLQPVYDEYEALLDRLAKQWHREGKLSSDFAGMPFGPKVTKIAIETKGSYYQHLDISLPLKAIAHDSGIHCGPAVFNLLRNKKLLDVAQMFVGPEIYSNPVQHVRIKPPQDVLPQELKDNTIVGRTFWHQDQGVIQSDSDNSNILTVWLPVTEATVENGCLTVVPKSHKEGLDLHCMTEKRLGIPDERIGPNTLPLPMSPGDVLFMTKFTKHASLENVSRDIRWSFDLRYQPIGHPTGRAAFPGFVARSRAHPGSELRDWKVWEAKWLEARRALAEGGTPNFRRWDPNDPMCA